VLVAAGALKLRAPAELATQIANYQLITAAAPYLAAALPAAELVVGLAVLAAPRPWRAGAALAALVLFALFEGAVTAAYLRGINIDCGCFGTGGGPITGLTILRNLLLMAAAATVLWLESRREIRAVAPGAVP
jgi:hypothetical protein